jgi:hypothetical protein
MVDLYPSRDNVSREEEQLSQHHNIKDILKSGRGLTCFHSVICKTTRIPDSPNSVFKKVPMVEKFHPHRGNLAREEEQLSQLSPKS